MLGDADSLIRGGFKFTTWLSSQSASKMLCGTVMLKSDYILPDVCLNFEWRAVVWMEKVTFIWFRCFPESPSPVRPRALSPPVLHVGSPVTACEASGRISRALSSTPTWGWDPAHCVRRFRSRFHRPRGSGATAAVFINNLVPNCNSLSISVNNNRFCQF